MKKIQMKYKMVSPLSHIGETASVGAYFNTIKTAEGQIPVITGNAIRGKLRDCMAIHLLDRIGEKKVDKEIFHVLFSGGNITGSMKDDVQRALLVREHIPMVSLLGGAIGTMMISGKLLSGFCYPICIETENFLKIESDKSWHDMISTIEFTRFDDSKNDKKSVLIENYDDENKGKASQQMRYEVEYIAQGTEFIQELTLLDGTTEIEEGALYTALKKWFEVPVVGGMVAKGFGKFDAFSDEIKVINGNIQISEYASYLIKKYEDLIDSEKDEFFYLLGERYGKK